MTEILAAIIATIGTVFVTLITYVLAKRAGIAPFQDQLVNKLKDLVEVQQEEFKKLQTRVADLETENSLLKVKIEDLEQLTISQAKMIDKLTTVPSRQRRARTTSTT